MRSPPPTRLQTPLQRTEIITSRGKEFPFGDHHESLHEFPQTFSNVSELMLLICKKESFYERRIEELFLKSFVEKFCRNQP